MKPTNDPYLASVRGNRLMGLANDITPGAGLQILTTAGLIYDLAPRERVLCTRFNFGVETVSDDCAFEIGWVDVNGHFHAWSSEHHVATGAALSGSTSYERDLYPPASITYEDGARRITFRVEPNDASCEISLGWQGWKELT